MKTVDILSVNTAVPRSLQVGKKSVTTGLFKEPRQGAVTLGQFGLEGDTIVHTKVHGGEDQAVYLYSAEDYAWWSQQLGREITPGTFGENLTISHFHEGELRIGDRLLIENSVVLEITAPRVPCAQFSTRMGDSGFAKRFVAARRPGAYARVLEAGEITAGDSGQWCLTECDYATVVEVFDQWHRKSWSEQVARKALNSPISSIARGIIEVRAGIKTSDT